MWKLGKLDAGSEVILTVVYRRMLGLPFKIRFWTPRHILQRVLFGFSQALGLLESWSTQQCRSLKVYVTPLHPHHLPTVENYEPVANIHSAD
ncbi:hypothetical protein TNCV_442011 [Trichonephila clavipes]|nr:hypothetical protein TNCV_442011 [Trichonephila clavipes]